MYTKSQPDKKLPDAPDPSPVSWQWVMSTLAELFWLCIGGCILTAQYWTQVGEVIKTNELNVHLRIPRHQIAVKTFMLQQGSPEKIMAAAQVLMRCITQLQGQKADMLSPCKINEFFPMCGNRSNFWASLA